jgi:ACS family glucarate transporter-like MFS transporter
VCVDVGKRHAGAVTGAMNTAGQLGSFLSSVAFGALVDAFGGRYDIPLVLFSGCLLLSAVIFLRIDASRPLIAES